jgi:hypothetical protein
MIEKKFGGSIPVQILVKGDNSGPKGIKRNEKNGRFFKNTG